VIVGGGINGYSAQVSMKAVTIREESGPYPEEVTEV
jgi:hypothetical protein